MAVDELIADTGFSVDRAIGVADHQLLLEVGHRTLRFVRTMRELIEIRAWR